MNKKISFFTASIISLLFCAGAALANPLNPPEDDMKEANEQTAKAAKILNEMMSAPDSEIPQDLLDSAECVAVFPSVIKGAFIVGAKGGKGLVSCRDAKTREWGAPVFMKIGGGSVGFQIGGEATDFILLGMNSRAKEMFTKDRFEIGGEATAAAGPVGRSASASTDLPTLRSEFLSYSRSRGAFAGVALKGSVITRDDDLNKAVYGTESAAQIMQKAPNQFTIFPHTLAKYAPSRRK